MITDEWEGWGNPQVVQTERDWICLGLIILSWAHLKGWFFILTTGRSLWCQLLPIIYSRSTIPPAHVGKDVHAYHVSRDLLRVATKLCNKFWRVSRMKVSNRDWTIIGHHSLDMLCPVAIITAHHNPVFGQDYTPVTKCSISELRLRQCWTIWEFLKVCPDQWLANFATELGIPDREDNGEKDDASHKVKSV